MEEFVYTLGASGLKRLSEHPELPKGTIVYAFGAGMEESRWATTGKGEESKIEIYLPYWQPSGFEARRGANKF